MELIALKKWFAMEGAGEDTKKVVFIVLSILGLRIIWEGIIWEWCSLRYLLMWCEHLPLAVILIICVLHDHKYLKVAGKTRLISRVAIECHSETRK